MKHKLIGYLLLVSLVSLVSCTNYTSEQFTKRLKKEGGFVINSTEDSITYYKDSAIYRTTYKKNGTPVLKLSADTKVALYGKIFSVKDGMINSSDYKLQFDDVTFGELLKKYGIPFSNYGVSYGQNTDESPERLKEMFEAHWTNYIPGAITFTDAPLFSFVKEEDLHNFVVFADQPNRVYVFPYSTPYYGVDDKVGSFKVEGHLPFDIEYHGYSEHGFYFYNYLQLSSMSNISGDYYGGSYFPELDLNFNYSPFSSDTNVISKITQSIISKYEKVVEASEESRRSYRSQLEEEDFQEDLHNHFISFGNDLSPTWLHNKEAYKVYPIRSDMKLRVKLDKVEFDSGSSDRLILTSYRYPESTTLIGSSVDYDFLELDYPCLVYIKGHFDTVITTYETRDKKRYEFYFSKIELIAHVDD